MSKRIKRVFATSREVVHIWASRSQSEGRCGNVFFEGDTIYSYGHHYRLGMIIDTKDGAPAVLLNNRTYSVTTSKHQREAHAAVSHLNRFYVPFIGNTRRDHIQNIIHWIISWGLSLELARTKRSTRLYTDSMGSKATSVVSYINTFKIKRVEEGIREFAGSGMSPSELIKNLRYMKKNIIPGIEKLEAKIVREAQTKLKRELRLAEKIEERRKIQEERNRIVAEKGVPRWIKGHDFFEHQGDRVLLGGLMWRLDKTYLRREGDEVVTSKGARVPVVRCKKLWSVMKVAMERKERMDKFNDTNRVGAYEFNSFDGETLIVGCHSIMIDEIERFTKQEGW